MAEPAASHLQQNVQHFNQEAQKWDEKPHIREWAGKVAAAYGKASIEPPSAYMTDCYLSDQAFSAAAENRPQRLVRPADLLQTCCLLPPLVKDHSITETRHVMAHRLK